MSENRRIPVVTPAAPSSEIKKEWGAVSEASTSRYTQDAVKGALSKPTRHREAPKVNAIHCVQVQVLADRDYYTAVAVGTPIQVTEAYLQSLSTQPDENTDFSLKTDAAE